MLDSIVYPIITGVVGGVIAVIVEYFVVAPFKERKTGKWNLPLSAKFIFLQFACIVGYEMLLKPLFPTAQISLSGILSDVNIAFAGVFYLCMASILVTAYSANNWIIFTGCFVVPSSLAYWWVFKYWSNLEGFLLNHKSATFVPIIHASSILWLCFGLLMVLEIKPSTIKLMALIIFPINGLYFLAMIIPLEAWVLAAIISGALLAMANIEESEIAYRQQHRQSRG